MAFFCGLIFTDTITCFDWNVLSYFLFIHPQLRKFHDILNLTVNSIFMTGFCNIVHVFRIADRHYRALYIGLLLQHECVCKWTHINSNKCAVSVRVIVSGSRLFLTLHGKSFLHFLSLYEAVFILERQSRFYYFYRDIWMHSSFHWHLLHLHMRHDSASTLQLQFL